MKLNQCIFVNCTLPRGPRFDGLVYQGFIQWLAWLNFANSGAPYPKPSVTITEKVWDERMNLKEIH
jgi:hypothetical protein